MVTDLPDPYVSHTEPEALIPNEIRWHLWSGFAERWPWYKRWWHVLIRSGRARYLWPWERHGG